MFGSYDKFISRTAPLVSFVKRYLDRSFSVPAEIFLFAFAMTVCSLIRVYYTSVVWPLDGGFQSFAMLFPFNFGDRPGIDYTPYLGIGISYALFPLYALLGQNFFASIASADLMTLAILFAALVTIALICDLPKACFTLLAAFVVFWATVLSKTIYGFTGVEFLTSGNSLLLLRQGLPWLVFLLLIAWAFVARRRSGGAETSAPASLSFPHYPAAVLAGVVPFWSNASGLATALALIITIALSAILSRARGWQLARILAIAAGLFLISLAATLLVLSAGDVQRFISDKFNGVADYQYWYFAPFKANYRIFTVSDLLRASIWNFGWTSLLGLAGMALALAGVWRRHGPTDLRFLGLLSILLALFGTGMIAQLGGHISERYLLTFYSFGFIIGVVTVAQAMIPWILAYTPLPIAYWPGIGRLVALVVLCIFVAATALKVQSDRAKTARVYYPPLGLYVEEGHAAELAALAQLHDLPSISDLLPEDRIFSGYLSPAEIGLNAEPATRFGANIHVLGDAARAEYMTRLQATPFPLVAQIAQIRGVQNWHHWQLRANWYLYSYILRHYEPAFRTRFMAFYRPRQVPLKLPLDLPNLTCSITYPAAHQVEIIIEDEALPGTPHFGDNWIFDAQVSYEATLGPRELPEMLLPLVGSRGMIIVSDNSSGFMESIVADYPAPHYLYSKEGGILFGLPMGPQRQNLAIEHRIGSPSRLLLTVEPADRGKIEVDACKMTPVLASPFVDFEEHFPLTTDVDPRQRL